jgi:hypothetical protein
MTQLRKVGTTVKKLIGFALVGSLFALGCGAATTSKGTTGSTTVKTSTKHEGAPPKGEGPDMDKMKENMMKEKMNREKGKEHAAPADKGEKKDDKKGDKDK